MGKPRGETSKGTFQVPEVRSRVHRTLNIFIYEQTLHVNHSCRMILRMRETLETTSGGIVSTPRQWFRSS